MRVGVYGIVCALAAACGAPTSGDRPDGRAPDAYEAPDDGTIRVIVFDEMHPGQRASGVRVLFTPNGGFPALVVTDQDGVAEASAAPDTDVTVIQSLTPLVGKRFVHFTALQPGDVVVAGPQRAAPRIAGSVIVKLPADPDGVFYTVATSCAAQGALVDGVPNLARIDFKTPCATAGSTTLVGRKHDANNVVTGVTVLDGVDLFAAATTGETIEMPPYTAAPAPITFTVSNLADDITLVSPWVVYTLGDDPWLLATAGGGVMATDPSVFVTNGYPVGDRTTFGFGFLHEGLGGAHSQYQEPAAAKTTSFAHDAGDMIESLVHATASLDEITWTTSPTGMHGTLVSAAISWGTTQGLVYAPYTGPALSLRGLPAEVQPTEVPHLQGLQELASEGMTYRDLVTKVEQARDFGNGIGVVAHLPIQMRYSWTSIPYSLAGFSTTEQLYVP